MGTVDFWSRHLAACQAQGISINAYAKREGLSAVSLYYWRKRLGLAGSRPRDVVASPFVPIQVERSGDCASTSMFALRYELVANRSRRCSCGYRCATQSNR
jgi:transposase-like protein